MSPLLDWLFPKFCVGCRGEGSWLCLHCYRDLYPPEAVNAIDAGCPDCQAPTEVNRYCVTHQPMHQLDGLIVLSPWHTGPLREAIHTLKYNGVRELARPLGRLLAAHLVAYFAENSQLAKAVVLPVPLHAKRHGQRGFNQAALLAEHLPNYQSRVILVRYRARPTQASLSQAERRHNLENVFGVRKNAQPLIAGRTILLVDDVTTTGATLDRAAAALKRAGASAVWGVVLARDY